MSRPYIVLVILFPFGPTRCDVFIYTFHIHSNKSCVILINYSTDMSNYTSPISSGEWCNGCLFSQWRKNHNEKIFKQARQANRRSEIDLLNGEIHALVVDRHRRHGHI